jgi:hypothetical protein
MKYSFYRVPGTVLLFGLPHDRPQRYKKLKPGAKLAVITSRKRRGDVTKVAQRVTSPSGYHYSKSYVSKVLNSQRSNSLIVNAAYDIARGRQKNSQK